MSGLLKVERKPELKTCTKCGLWKSLVEFHIKRRRWQTKRGLVLRAYFDSWCKSCQRKAWNHTEGQKAACRKHYHNVIANDPERLAKRNAKHCQYTKENPLKVLARNKIRRALKARKIIKQPCEVCGCLDSQAHHEDYTKPLEVRWLCLTHHALLHRKAA